MNERTSRATGEPPAALDAPELELLRLLESHPDYSQRQMSTALGVSLGKAHYLLKALLDKGWVKAKNFKRSQNKVGYLYVLTPSGVHQRLRLTRSFLARKEREYDQLQSQIAALRAELAARATSTSNGETTAP
jgi:EPS-associated MarR family transcriptional regulator